MSGVSSMFDVGTQGHGGFVGRTAIMAIVGGTFSMLGGGKFASGALAGAFVHMFNAEFSWKALWKGLTGGMRKVGSKIADGSIKNDATKGFKGLASNAPRAFRNAHPAAKGVLVVAGGQVMLGGIYGAEATYFWANANPLSAYGLAEAFANTGYTTAGAVGLGSSARALGETIGQIIW